MNCHGNTDLCLDTLDSARTFVTKDIIAIVDGSHWDSWGKDAPLPVSYKFSGFDHNKPKAPFRNVALAIKQVSDIYPDADWYLYFENDVLFGSSAYLQDLEAAEKDNVGIMGFGSLSDFSESNINMSFIERLFSLKFDKVKYILGACVFLRGDFVRKLKEISFFDKFLLFTASVNDIPEYNGYDISEHLYPTLAYKMGYSVRSLSNYFRMNLWTGNFIKYPVRWKPVLDPEFMPDASIMHPIKELNETRAFHYQKRKRHAKNKKD